MYDAAAHAPVAWIGSTPHGHPDISPDAWLAPGTIVTGRVRIGSETSVWYGSVLRGDSEEIVLGRRCNVQDLCCLHADPGEPAVLGDRVSLGHKAMVHGARVEDGALIGIGAVVLGGATVGTGSLVAAGALVGPGKQVPAGVLFAGVPGRVVRELTEEDRAGFADTPETYHRLSQDHARTQWHPAES
ncbi:gamma carbonic anhydrase family protein [Lipingzhangella sp. LS1_29]|uniref:Gamma carbonic anhydrase family protein n=1 Tax=Lipingzhangella rawalii TaxID=2055835 RepID=A0ABU2H471_9ACTN|nr:gamma carbonic anhydrase family protein [Lipingzhangella rawalii]MDS1270093.1 gamma carbonic anhydrase family protein [Lipingzhangella rawalii]